MKKEIIVVGIIFLFIGVGIQPAFATNLRTSCDSSTTVSENDNLNNALVKIPVQIHKSGKIETHTLTITKEQGDELDAFSDAFKEELDEAETFEETIAIYNNAIVTLDKIGLIPKGISVEELQRLITGNFQLKLFRYIMQIYKYKGNRDVYSNFFCLVSGDSSWTGSWLLNYAPIWIGPIYYGWEYYDFYSVSIVEVAYGWIHTQSFIRNWIYEGDFIGWIMKLADYPLGRYDYIGALGFTGLFFILSNLYIGYAYWVRIKPYP